MRLKRIGPEGEPRKEKPGFSPKEQEYINRAMERKRLKDEAAEGELQALVATREAREREEADMGEDKAPEPPEKAIPAPRTLLGGLKPAALKFPPLNQPRGVIAGSQKKKGAFMPLPDDQMGPSAEAEAKSVKEYQVVSNLRPVEELSREEAEQEIIRTRHDKTSPYHDPKNPLSRGASSRMKTLYQKAFPAKTPAEKDAEYQGYQRHAEEKQAELDAEKADREMRKTEEALKMQWGRDFDRNISLARRVIGRFTSEEDQIFLEKTGLGSDPQFIQLIHRIGKSIEEREAKLKKRR